MNTQSDSGSDPKLAKTFPQLVRAAAATYGDSPAIVLRSEGEPDEVASFAELERHSAELARGLMARGVGKGTRVGFIAGNGPLFGLWMAAIARLGAVAIPISTMIKANELIRVLRQSDVTGLIVQRSFMSYDYAERLVEALPELAGGSADLRLPRTPYLRWIVTTGENLPSGIRDLAWLSEAAGTVSEELLIEAEKEVHTTDQMVEIYTSGSMALPKGVRHLHGPVLFRSHFMADITGVTPGKQLACHLPMFWIGGLMMSLMPNWERGATTICGEKTLNNSRMAMGSVLPAEDLALMSNQPRPWWGLGMSETLGPYSHGDEFRAEGWPVCAPMDNIADGYEVRIADEDDNHVQVGEIGELQIRGYPVTPGLHKVERDGYYTVDGYYHTGDMVLVEQRGEKLRYNFVGRNGDMIKTASSNVSPAEVEMEMQALDGVHSAYVVGLPDKERGQIVVAAVVPRDGCTLDYAEIEAQLRKNMSGYKVPRAYVEISREDVPMLHSNKVSKRMIADLVAKRLDRPAA